MTVNLKSWWAGHIISSPKWNRGLKMPQILYCQAENPSSVVPGYNIDQYVPVHILILL